MVYRNTFKLKGERLEILRLGDSISIHTNGRTFCLDPAQAEELGAGLYAVLHGHDRAQTEDMIETYDQRPPIEAAKLPRGDKLPRGNQGPTLEDI
jgi:hypothetical protein